MSAHKFTASAIWIATAGTLAGCVVQAPPSRVQVAPVPAAYYEPAPPPPVVSVYVEPPLDQPPPVLVGWAPPPMLVDVPPPIPFGGAIWVGGYWAWQGTWVWASGRWAPPPQPGYGWVHPYYENRGGGVVFVTGHWSPPGVVFVPPPLGLNISLAVASPGVVPGPRPIGPPGIFVPPPPGSRPGLIVPAPIGTAPAVVIGAPPVTNVGMRVENRVTNNVTVNNVTNISNVTIVAPANATASGRPYQGQAPALAHLAAAQSPVMHIVAPTPASNRPIPAFAADRSAPALPPAQAVQVRRESNPGGMAAGSAPIQRVESPPSRPLAPAPVSPPAPAAEMARPEAATRFATPPTNGSAMRPAEATRQATPPPVPVQAKPGANPAARPPAPQKPHPEKARPQKPPKEGEEHREQR